MQRQEQEGEGPAGKFCLLVQQKGQLGVCLAAFFTKRCVAVQHYIVVVTDFLLHSAVPGAPGQSGNDIQPIKKHVCLWSEDKDSKTAPRVKLEPRTELKIQRTACSSSVGDRVLIYYYTPSCNQYRSRSGPQCPDNVHEIVNNAVRQMCQEKDKITSKWRVIGFLEQLEGLEELGNDSEGRW